MAPRDLSFVELASATALLVEGPHATFFRSSATGPIFASDFDALRGTLLRAPADSVETERLTNLLTAEDAAHDREVRFGDGVLSNFEKHAWDPEVRAVAGELRALLFPDGVTLVQKSYPEEVGRGVSRAALLTPEVRAKLARFPLPVSAGGPANLDEWMTVRLQASAARLGALLEERGRVARDESPQPAVLLDAKRRFIALMKQVLLTFTRMEPRLSEPEKALVRTIQSSWDEAVRQGTARADRRRATGKDEPPPPAA